MKFANVRELKNKTSEILRKAEILRILSKKEVDRFIRGLN